MADEAWLIRVPFYGKWSMKVIGRNTDLKQQVMIVGAVSGGGPVDGVVGQSVAAIDGPLWYAEILSTQNPAAGWNASRVKRVPGVISPDGMIVTLYSDDNPAAGANDDFDDLIVQFGYLNPEVNPPGVPPYEFTVPSGSFRPTRPRRDQPRCKCDCACTCGTAKRPRRGCKC